MTSSTFADRFWYARQLKGIGAPTLMKQVAQTLGLPSSEELSPSLISTIERKNQKSSRYNDAFAKVLGVDPKWLAAGEGSAPRGFDEAEARKGRLAEIGRNQRGTPLSIVRDTAEAPQWAAPPEVDEEEQLQRKQAQLTADLIEFARRAGSERVHGFLKAMEPLLATFGVKEAPRQKHSRTP